MRREEQVPTSRINIADYSSTASGPPSLAREGFGYHCVRQCVRSEPFHYKRSIKITIKPVGATRMFSGRLAACQVVVLVKHNENY